MASNQALRENALELASDLKIDLGDISEEAGFNNAKLADLVKDLRAKKTDKETDSAADTAKQNDTGTVDEKSKETVDEKAKDEDTAIVPAKIKPLVVTSKKQVVKGPRIAEGRSITATAGRILGPGESVSPKDLSGGDEAFKNLREAGLIVDE